MAARTNQGYLALVLVCICAMLRISMCVMVHDGASFVEALKLAESSGASRDNTHLLIEMTQSIAVTPGDLPALYPIYLKQNVTIIGRSASGGYPVLNLGW